LWRYHPELHQLVLAGEITLYSAAAAAGFRGTGVPRAAALDEATITPLQTFASARDCRRLWEAHRKRLLDRWGDEGRRPQAWWKFDTSIPYPGYARERSTLWAAGLLGKQERHALEAYWREEFARAWQPGFAAVSAPGEIYHGEAARQKHFAWADIPSALVQQWEAARHTKPLGRQRPALGACANWGANCLDAGWSRFCQDLGDGSPHKSITAEVWIE
jgi:hypothetical protein